MIDSENLEMASELNSTAKTIKHPQSHEMDDGESIITQTTELLSIDQNSLKAILALSIRILLHRNNLHNRTLVDMPGVEDIHQGRKPHQPSEQHASPVEILRRDLVRIGEE